MWPFNRNRRTASNVQFRGLTDWHSHILPGVDDGVKTMDEALLILEHLEKAGVVDVWLTPHIMEDYPNSTDMLRARFGELIEAYRGNIKLHLAAENMLDNIFEERLKADDLLPMSENRLLVETSYFNPPIGLNGILEDIIKHGYRPVLAHPERYLYMNADDYKTLQAMGILFQLNIFSLTGYYGKEAQKKAKWLQKQGMYSISGTDLHNSAALSRIPLQQ